MKIATLLEQISKNVYQIPFCFRIVTFICPYVLKDLYLNM